MKNRNFFVFLFMLYVCVQQSRVAFSENPAWGQILHDAYKNKGVFLRDNITPQIYNPVQKDNPAINTILFDYNGYCLCLPHQTKELLVGLPDFALPTQIIAAKNKDNLTWTVKIHPFVHKENPTPEENIVLQELVVETPSNYQPQADAIPLEIMSMVAKKDSIASNLKLDIHTQPPLSVPADISTLKVKPNIAIHSQDVDATPFSIRVRLPDWTLSIGLNNPTNRMLNGKERIRLWHESNTNLQFMMTQLTQNGMDEKAASAAIQQVCQELSALTDEALFNQSLAADHINWEKQTTVKAAIRGALLQICANDGLYTQQYTYQFQIDEHKYYFYGGGGDTYHVMVYDKQGELAQELYVKAYQNSQKYGQRPNTQPPFTPAPQIVAELYEILNVPKNKK